MKNLAFCSLLFLLPGLPGLLAQKLAQPKPELVIYTGLNKHGWDNSSGSTVGLEAAFPLAGRLGVALGWGFGQNRRPDNEFHYLYSPSNDRSQRFFNTEIGLARTGKSGRWRFGAGVSHQYLPKPLPEGLRLGVDCLMGASDEFWQELSDAERMADSGLNLFGANLNGAVRWPLGKRLFGSLGMKLYWLQGPKFPQLMGQESRMSMAEMRLSIGMRHGGTCCRIC